MEIRDAPIELSVKVVDSQARLESTLLHELCHAATWLIDKEPRNRRDHHGESARVASVAISVFEKVWMMDD